MYPQTSIELARLEQAEKLHRAAGHHPGSLGRALRDRVRIRRAPRAV